MRVPLRPEAVGEPEEVDLVDGAQHFSDRTLDDLVLQGRHAPIELHSVTTDLWDRLKSSTRFTHYGGSGLSF